jgi:membrane-bound lytic murein transglycosylase F
MQPKNPLQRIVGVTLVGTLCLILVGSKTPSALDKVLLKGELTILSRNGPTTYYEGPNGLTGFEYSLAKAFADELGVDLTIQAEDNLGILIESVGSARGEMGASGLTVTENRQKKVRFTRPYLEVTQQVIYRAGEHKPESVTDLIDADILVIANSAHSERLRSLQLDYPQLRWREQIDLEMLDLVSLVHSGEVQYAIVDSNAFNINGNIYPQARVAFDISEPQSLAWAFAKGSDDSLFQLADDFLARMEADGRLAKITDHFYGHIAKVNNSGAKLYAKRIEDRLPLWEPLLRNAGMENNIDWRLLAAMSYQESHWNSGAVSTTGVRGLMMLTQATAKDMGIANRVDPEQSIAGGARYFKLIFDRIPQRVQGTDRTWMALAAYNVGLGHLEDARVLTERSGDDPNKWADVKRYLPLLAQRKYYKETKHGFARGWEPVDYVQNIRQFYNILSWHDQLQTRRYAQADITPDMRPVNVQGGAADPSVSL